MMLVLAGLVIVMGLIPSAGLVVLAFFFVLVASLLNAVEQFYQEWLEDGERMKVFCDSEADLKEIRGA